MEWIFYSVSTIAVALSLLVVTRLNPVHALLYLVVTLLAFAILFWLLGAAFAAVLEIIIYAGAIMVLMVFAIMMLNQGSEVVTQESEWLKPSVWLAPGVLALVLLLLLLSLLHAGTDSADVTLISAKQVGISLFGPYVIAVELASFLLLAGLVGAFHLSRALTRREEPDQ